MHCKRNLVCFHKFGFPCSLYMINRFTGAKTVALALIIGESERKIRYVHVMSKSISHIKMYPDRRSTHYSFNVNFGWKLKQMYTYTVYVL